MQIPFCGPTYEGRSKNFDTSRCINFFPEISVNPESKNKIYLVGTPGTELFASKQSGEVRLLYNFAGTLFTVIADCLYSITEGGVFSSVLGRLTDTTNDVFAADNGVERYGVGGNQLILISNSIGYLYNIKSGLFSKIPKYFPDGMERTNFPLSPSTVTYLDGYFIVTDNSMSFYVSNLYDGNIWSGLATAAAVATPDKIQRAVSLNQQLYLIKSWSTEVWYNAGIAASQGSPFARQPGVVLPFGTPAPKSIAYGLDTIFFISNQGHSGSAQFAGVSMLEGYNPTIISIPPINYRISKMANITDARGYFYLNEGHSFYILTFPTDNVTFAYDLTTKMWHERSTYSVSKSYTNRHLSNHYTYFAGKHLVSDFRYPRILNMSSDIYSDSGDPIISVRTSPIIGESREGSSVFIHRLVVEIEGGVGDDSITTNSVFAWLADGSKFADGSAIAGGYDLIPSHNARPLAKLAWSNDSGHTWSSNYFANIGLSGEYGKRLIWRALGKARSKVFRITMDDSIKKIILNAYINDGSLS